MSRRWPWPRRLRYALEAAALWPLLALIRLLPPRWASALGGSLLGLVGPLLAGSRVARANLARFLPERAADHDKIIRDMWDNIGRTLAEYPHLARLAPTVPIIGRTHLETALTNGPVLVASAHLANWEIGIQAALAQIPQHRQFAIVQRPPNNPFIARFLEAARGHTLRQFPKGRQGAKGLLAHLQAGQAVVLLVDQKMNDGIAVPFFGTAAMTAPAIAQLARRFACPIIPAHAQRLADGSLQLIFEPALPPVVDEYATMQRLNEIIAVWVRAQPAQWLWLHRRWPDP